MIYNNDRDPNDVMWEKQNACYLPSEIIEEGTLIDRWPCDVNEYDEMQSNGSQEYLYEYKGNKYCVWMDWEDNPICPDVKIYPSEY